VVVHSLARSFRWLDSSPSLNQPRSPPISVTLIRFEATADYNVPTENFNFRTFQFSWALVLVRIISNRLIPSAISSSSVSCQYRRVYNFLTCCTATCRKCSICQLPMKECNNEIEHATKEFTGA